MRGGVRQCPAALPLSARLRPSAGGSALAVRPPARLQPATDSLLRRSEGVPPVLRRMSLPLSAESVRAALPTRFALCFRMRLQGRIRTPDPRQRPVERHPSPLRPSPRVPAHPYRPQQWQRLPSLPRKSQALAVGVADLLDIMTSDSQFSTLASALQTAGLVSSLRTAGPFTIFAPTNAAFNSMSLSHPARPIINQIRQNPNARLSSTESAALDNLLRYHVLPKRLDTSSIPSNTRISERLCFSSFQSCFSYDQRNCRTLTGASMELQRLFQLININGNTNANLQPSTGSNGIIFRLDKVLIPPSTGVVGSCKDPSRMIYSASATACPEYCGQPASARGVVCGTTAGCQCRPGFVFATSDWRNANCVPRSGCGGGGIIVRPGGSTRQCPVLRDNTMIINRRSCRQAADCSAGTELCCAVGGSFGAAQCVCPDANARRSNGCMSWCGNDNSNRRCPTGSYVDDCHCTSGLIWSADPRRDSTARCINPIQCSASNPTTPASGPLCFSLSSTHLTATLPGSHPVCARPCSLARPRSGSCGLVIGWGCSWVERLQLPEGVSDLRICVSGSVQCSQRSAVHIRLRGWMLLPSWLRPPRRQRPQRILRPTR